MERIARIAAGMVVTLSLVAGLATLAGGSDAGEELYAANCAKCHGDDGRAQTPVGKAMKATSLVDPQWAAEDSASALVSAFRENSKHKAIAGKLSDEDLLAIAGHVRQLASAGE